MFYQIKFYLKYIFITLVFALLCVIFYEIYQFKSPVKIELENYKIYTNQNVIIFLFLAFCYIGMKFFGILISFNTFFVGFKYRVSDKLETLKSYFNMREKSEMDLLNEIKSLKRKKLYRHAFKITSENYVVSERILFWHYFLLLKLGKRREFFRLFKIRPSGLSIKLFTLVYLKNKFFLSRIFIIRKLFLENEDNQVFVYIYANSLFMRKYYKKAQIILLNFLNNKRILMVDIHCSYLMNILAIKLEKAINKHNGNDFILSYRENIEAYNEKRKK